MRNYKSRLTSYLIPVLATLVCTSAFARENDGNGNTSPGAGQSGVVLEAQELRSTERDGDWLERVRDTLEREEYKPSVASDEAGRQKLQAPNRAHNFRTYFDDDGVRVVPRDGSRKWEFFIKLDSTDIERGRKRERKNRDERGRPEAREDSVEYAHGDVTEWYKNDKRGLELGFTIAQSGDEPDDLITINCTTSRQYEVMIEPTGKGLVFTDRSTDTQLQLKGLTAFDDDGKALATRFEVSDSGFSIIVDTVGAKFPIVVDPWLMATEWSMTGGQALAKFGVSAASAGDVNGDGFDDVIIGADYYDNGQADEGGVFLFYGSANGLSSTVGWSAESGQASAYFGRSIAGAGDVNNDTYDDIIVGAPYYNNGHTDEGRVYLYLGSPSGPTSTAIWTSSSNYAESNQTSAYFGSSVASAGDVNCDGKADVIIGAPYYNGGHTNEGRAYVYLGTATGLNATPWTAESNQTNAYFGTSVAGIGNVNGNGCDDIAIGADHYDNGQTDEGKVFVFYGTTSGFNPTPWTAESNQPSAYFGVSVAGAGDVNHDGVDDLLIGADHYDNGQADEGRAFLYLGSTSGLASSPVWMSEPDVATSGYGFRVSGAGDVNGDGYADVIVGAQYVSNAETNEGRVYVYYGNSTPGVLPSTANWKAESNLSSANFGAAVARAGDVNGDGYGDVIIGAPLYASTVSGGRSFLYYGSPFGLPWQTENFNTASRMGSSVAILSDLNEDSFDYLVVGASSYSGGQSGEGQVLFYKGSASGVTQLVRAIECDQVGAHMGYSVASAGDINGNGYDDVLVAAPDFDIGQSDEGRVYVYEGETLFNVNPPAPVILEIDEERAVFGRSISSAGDINGDGYGDIVIGAPMRNNSQHHHIGGAFVYYGSPSGINPANKITLTVDTDDSISFGEAVSGGGDINGDGYDDIVIGTNNHGQWGYPGEIYIYYGSASGINVTQPTTIAYGALGDVFGSTVASGRDINNDGYADVVVGSYGGNSIYVFLGSSTGIGSVPTVIQAPPGVSYGFGRIVAYAGSVNGDNYADVVTTGVNGLGYNYLYLGSATGLLSSPEWYGLGSSSISGGGDLNNDGFDDIVAGNSSYSLPSSSVGKVCVYYGDDLYSVDTDGDGLSDRSELSNYGTSPTSRYTDGDCLSDYDEIFLYGTNPNSSTQDTDGDQLTDADEICLYNTNRLLLDTDSDGLDDGVELAYWGAQWDDDPDADGLVNLLDPDSDNDGMNDGYEVSHGLDPTVAALDQDDADNDGYPDIVEWLLGSLPDDPDSVPCGSRSFGFNNRTEITGQLQ